MSTIEEPMDRRIPLRVVFGPLMVVLSVVPLLLKDALVHWYLPCIALAAIPLCCRWGWRGAAGASALFFSCLGITYYKAPFPDMVWYGGLGLAFALAYASTALSWEEVDSFFHRLIVRSQNHDDAVQTLSVRNQEMALLGRHLEAARSALIESEEAVRTLSEKNQEIAPLENELKAQRTSQSEQTQRTRSLEADLKAAVADRDGNRKQMQTYQQKYEDVDRILAEKGQWIKSLERKVEESRKEAESAVAERDSIRKQIDEQARALRSLQEKLQAVQAVPAPALINGRTIESLYSQLKQQFEEKSALLDAARRELFLANEKLMQWQLEREEKNKFGDDALWVKEVAKLSQANEEAQKEIATLQDLVTSLMQSNGSWKQMKFL